MEKLAEPHPDSGSMPLVGQAGSHERKTHRPLGWKPLPSAGTGQAARASGAEGQWALCPVAGWAPERDGNTSPPGAEGTAVRSPSPGLAPPAQAAARSWGGVLEAGLVLAPGMAAPADGGLCTPEPYLHPGKRTRQELERAAGRQAPSPPARARHSQGSRQHGPKVDEWAIAWSQTPDRANLTSTLLPGP